MFRALLGVSNDALVDFVMARMLRAHPHLKRGETMQGTLDFGKDGKKVQLTANTDLTDTGLYLLQAQDESNRCLISFDWVLDDSLYHPVDDELAKATGYIHPYVIVIPMANWLINSKVGEVQTFVDPHDFSLEKKVVTQQMFDDAEIIMCRFGLSKNLREAIDSQPDSFV